MIALNMIMSQNVFRSATCVGKFPCGAPFRIATTVGKMVPHKMAGVVV